MSGDALLAIDLGTTRLKVAAFDPDGRLLSLRTRRHGEHREADRVWQSPDEWWTDTAELMQHMLADLDGRRVLGLSLSGRGGAAVFTDAAGAVVEPPWSDARHRDELRALGERRGALSRYAAVLLAKTLWLRKHRPDAFRRVRHVLYAKDFLLYRLTGVASTDWSSGPDAPSWDAAVLAEVDLDPALLPAPALPWEIAGRLTSGAGSELGLPVGTPVAVGAHDGICANVGAGACAPGAFAITLGTHAVVRAIASEPVAGALRFYGLPPDRHVIGGNALMAGRALEWLVDLWFEPSEDARRERFTALDTAASHVPPGAGGVLFLPFLSGRRAPAPRPGAAAALAGLRLEHGRAEIWRAALEGTAFAIAEIFAQVLGWCGAPSVVRLTGSGAQSEVWTGILADALEQPLEVTDAAVEARGAAVFLATALGLYPDVDRAAAAMVRTTATREPDPDRVAAYRDVYASWTALANATRPLDRA